MTYTIDLSTSRADWRGARNSVYIFCANHRLRRLPTTNQVTSEYLRTTRFYPGLVFLLCILSSLVLNVEALQRPAGSATVVKKKKARAIGQSKNLTPAFVSKMPRGGSDTRVLSDDVAHAIGCNIADVAVAAVLLYVIHSDSIILGIPMGILFVRHRRGPLGAVILAWLWYHGVGLLQPLKSGVPLENVLGKIFHLLGFYLAFRSVFLASRHAKNLRYMRFRTNNVPTSATRRKIPSEKSV